MISFKKTFGIGMSKSKKKPFRLIITLCIAVIVSFFSSALCCMNRVNTLDLSVKMLLNDYQYDNMRVDGGREYAVGEGGHRRSVIYESDLERLTKETEAVLRNIEVEDDSDLKYRENLLGLAYDASEYLSVIKGGYSQEDFENYVFWNGIKFLDTTRQMSGIQWYHHLPLKCGRMATNENECVISEKLVNFFLVCKGIKIGEGIYPLEKTEDVLGITLPLSYGNYTVTGVTNVEGYLAYPIFLSRDAVKSFGEYEFFHIETPKTEEAVKKLVNFEFQEEKKREKNASYVGIDSTFAKSGLTMMEGFQRELNILWGMECVLIVFELFLMIRLIWVNLEQNRKTIGILKYSGASDREIFFCFLWEAIIIGMISLLVAFIGNYIFLQTFWDDFFYLSCGYHTPYGFLNVLFDLGTCILPPILCSVAIIFAYVRTPIVDLLQKRLKKGEKKRERKNIA